MLQSPAVGIGVLFLLALFVLRYFHLLKSWEDVRRPPQEAVEACYFRAGVLSRTPACWPRRS
jgi:hypothetical protein